jgi:LacI family transcriptional regulator
VQQLLEERQYIPSMAGILLAQNDSKIIGVVINDHEKYKEHTLEDPFISASVNALAKEIGQAGKFLMLKVTDKWEEIPSICPGCTCKSAEYDFRRDFKEWGKDNLCNDH